MKSLFILALACLFVSPAAPGQAKAVHFKKLQDFLPSIEMKGFERKKPTGQTQTTMGMTTSEAKVRYVTKPPEKEVEGEEAPMEQSVEIVISDMAGVPFGQMSAMAYQQEFENESEDGYEKSVTIKGTYKGKESAQTGDYKTCALEFMVGNRFVLKFDGRGFSDPAMLMKLVDSIDLPKLEKLTP